MPIPLLAAGAAKAAAAKTAAAAAIKTAAVNTLGTGIAKATGTAAKSKLSLSMLADPKIDVYSGSKIKTFAKKAGKFLENTGGKTNDIKFSEPTKADISRSGNLPSNPDATYSKQIDKLDSLRS